MNDLFQIISVRPEISSEEMNNQVANDLPTRADIQNLSLQKIN